MCYDCRKKEEREAKEQELMERIEDAIGRIVSGQLGALASFFPSPLSQPACGKQGR